MTVEQPFSDDRSDDAHVGVFIPKRPSRKKLWMIVTVMVMLAITATVLLQSSIGGNDDSRVRTVPVERRDLTIVVTESGTLQARKSVDYKSEVEPQVTILYLMPEGTYITADDVQNGKILARLDKAPLEEKLAPSQKELLQAQARYTQAKEEYGITLGQNESDVAAGRLDVEFGRMDLQRYLGRNLAADITQNLSDDPNSALDPQYLLQDPNLLGGASRQRNDQLRDNIVLAQAKLKRSQDRADSTRKLYEVEYVSEMELEGDLLEVESSRVQHQQALTELELFRMYDLPKEAKQLFSGYREKLRELDRIHAKTRAREAQARSQLAAREAELNWAQERVRTLERQIAACTIKATAPGLVIHASGRDIFGRVIPELEIREGLLVRHGQQIITLPHTSEMRVQLGVSETTVHKVRGGQRATVTVDAFPDQTYHGEVSHVAQLPNPQGLFSSDTKVYLVQVDLMNTEEGLKPGMSAKAEIVVEKLGGVLAIPIRCIMNSADKKICLVQTSKGIEKREINTGSLDAIYVHVTSGLAADERVVSNPLRYVATGRLSKSGDNRGRPDGNNPND